MTIVPTITIGRHTARIQWVERLGATTEPCPCGCDEEVSIPQYGKVVSSRDISRELAMVWAARPTDLTDFVSSYLPKPEVH